MGARTRPHTLLPRRLLGSVAAPRLVLAGHWRARWRSMAGETVGSPRLGLTASVTNSGTGRGVAALGGRGTLGGAMTAMVVCAWFPSNPVLDTLHYDAMGHCPPSRVHAARFDNLIPARSRTWGGTSILCSLPCPCPPLPFRIYHDAVLISCINACTSKSCWCSVGGGPVSPKPLGCRERKAHVDGCWGPSGDRRGRVALPSIGSW